MTSDSIPGVSAPSSRLRKLILQTVIGAIVGAAAMVAALSMFERSVVGRATPEQAFGIGVGVIYVLMGLFVLMGASVPSIGAKLLNVGDADELRDDRGYLMWSALVCMSFGVALIIAVPASPAVGAVSPALSLGLFIAALVISIVAWRRMRAGQDEFRRLISAESSQTGLMLVMLVFGGWAVAAQLGYAAMFTPLTFIAGLLGLTLVGAFITVFQRGLMVR